MAPDRLAIDAAKLAIVSATEMSVCYRAVNRDTRKFYYYSATQIERKSDQDFLLPGEFITMDSG